MTGHGVSDDDMPDFPWHSQGDVPPIEDEALEALLAQDQRPDEASPGLQSAAEVLAALRAAVEDSELAGWNQALAEFRGTSGVSHTSRRAHQRRPTLIGSLLTAKFAAAAAAAAIAAVGSGVAAAYTGVLPARLQEFARKTIAAPAANASASAGPTSSPAGPDAKGPAAYGLCTAYRHAEAHGNASQRAVAFRNLAAAAGGAGKITAYCATVPHPGASPSAAPTSTPTPAAHRTGRPSTLPTQAEKSHPGGKPTSPPAGKPSGVPGRRP
jgi:hypothetical protein